MSRERLLVDNLDLVERVIRFTTRRYRCPPDEAEEFSGVVRLALVEDDYAILAAFGGRSRLDTYLTVVVQRLFLDFRVRNWGKWRPSAAARRLGPLAMQLERHLLRDGMSFAEAFQQLRQLDPTINRGRLLEIASCLPLRANRRTESLEESHDPISPEAAPDEAMIEDERLRRKHHSEAVLSRVVEALDPRDQLILRLHFDEGRKISDIARALHVDARPLYRRIEWLIRELRGALAAEGLTPQDFGWNRSKLGSRAAEEVRPVRAKGTTSNESVERNS